MQNRAQPNQGSSHVDRRLYDVGPDYGGEAALKGINQRERSDNHDGSDFARTEGNRHHNRHRVHPHSFRGGAGYQKKSSSQRTQSASKAAFDEFVSGIKITFEVVRKKNEADYDAADHIPHYNLKKREVRVIGEAGNTDDGERAGFGGNDRKSDGPPGDIAPRQKVVAKGALL